jgi:hypothetical protein
MDADLGTLHAPQAAAEVMDEGCRRARERGPIDIVRSATYVDKADKRMAIRRMADIGGAKPSPTSIQRSEQEKLYRNFNSIKIRSFIRNGAPNCQQDRRDRAERLGDAAGMQRQGLL